MTTYYLYVKTHNKTGLKYFGFTSKKDPYGYKGSGKYWLRHIKKHGYNVSTKIILTTTCLNVLRLMGYHYSQKWNIVESIDWANLIIENGRSYLHTEETKIKLKNHISNKMKSKRKWWNNGFDQKFVENPPNNSYRHGRMKFNNRGAKIGSDIQKQKHWITNGIIDKMVFKNQPIIAGFHLGRSNKKLGTQTKLIGHHWINNGIVEKMVLVNSDPIVWINGRLKTNKT